MMIFLQVLKGHSIRNIAERFQHSYSTISIAVHQVSASILLILIDLPPLESLEYVLHLELHHNCQNMGNI